MTSNVYYVFTFGNEWFYSESGNWTHRRDRALQFKKLTELVAFVNGQWKEHKSEIQIYKIREEYDNGERFQVTETKIPFSCSKPGLPVQRHWEIQGSELDVETLQKIIFLIKKSFEDN